MIHLNYSEMKAFRRCPRLYQKKHVEDRAGEEDLKRSFLGDVLGKLVEQFYVQQWWRFDGLDWTMKAAAAVLVRQLTDAGGIRWTHDEKLVVEEKIAKAIPQIIATIKQEKLLSSEVYTEHETTLDYTDIVPDDMVRIHGRIDVVIVRKGVLTILDAKAGTTIGRFAEQNQLRQYALAVWKSSEFGRIPDKVGFWWLRHGQVVWIDVSAANLMAYEKRMKDIARKMLAGDYPPRVGGWCLSCAFRMECPEGKAHGMSKETKVSLDTNVRNLGTVSL